MNKKISRIIEKRVRKEIRINKLISKNDTILIIDDGSYKFKISQKLLKNIVQDMPVTIEIKKTKYILGDNFDSKWNKIIIPWNLDDENEYFLTSVFFRPSWNREDIIAPCWAFPSCANAFFKA